VSRIPATDESGRPIVAELGRAETPDEVADRKAAASAARRANQTAVNLVIALLASLAVVALILLVVVRPQGIEREPIDYAEIAAGAEDSTGVPLAAPRLPEGWSANRAELVRGDDGILTWRIGFVTPAEQYIGLVQGIDADDRWAGDQVEHARESGTARLGGVSWRSYDRRSEPDPGNLAYALVAGFGDSTVVLGGTASDEEFEVLATAVAESLGAAASGGAS